MSLVDPGAVPGADLDLASVRSGASGLASNGGAIRDGGASIVRDWQQLPASFQATGTEALYTAMLPVGTTTTTIGDSLDAIAAALGKYADEVGPIKARLDSLRAQATSFAAKAKAFTPHTEMVSDGLYSLWIPRPERIDSWDQDPGMSDTNNALIRDISAAEADWLDAQQRCANAIRAAVGMGATGVADEQAMAGQLRSHDQLQTPWGQTGDRKESCSEKADTFGAHFLWDGVIVGFGWGTVKSLWTLQGLNPDSVLKAGHGLLTGNWDEVVQAGKEDLNALGNAWLGVAHLASSIAIPISPAERMALLHSGAMDWLPDDVRHEAESWTAGDGTALYGTLAGMVGLTLPKQWWDPKAYKADQVFGNWIENPGGAAGTATATIGSFFLPGVGEARGAGVAADAARAGGTGARAAEGLRVGDAIADGSLSSLKGLSADALRASITGLSEADAGRLAAELAKPELDAGALSSLKLDDLRIHDPAAAGNEHVDVPASPAEGTNTVNSTGATEAGRAAQHEPAPVDASTPSDAVHPSPEADAAPTASGHGDGSGTQPAAGEHGPAVDHGALEGTAGGDVAPAGAGAEVPAVHSGSGQEGVPATEADAAGHGAEVSSSEHAYSAAIFGPSNMRFYDVPAPGLGREGSSFFVMPAEDAARIHDAASAARYTGMSPSTLKAYQEGSEVYGILFPSDGIPHRLPTAADANGWEHFLPGGHTAVRLEGPAGGYLVNPTREFVIPGGTKVPPGSVLVRIGRTEWTILRRW